MQPPDLQQRLKIQSYQDRLKGHQLPHMRANTNLLATFACTVAPLIWVLKNATVVVSTDMSEPPCPATLHNGQAQTDRTWSFDRPTQELQTMMQDQGEAAPCTKAPFLSQSMQPLLSCPAPAWQTPPPTVQRCTAVEPGSHKHCLVQPTRKLYLPPCNTRASAFQSGPAHKHPVCGSIMRPLLLLSCPTPAPLDSVNGKPTPTQAQEQQQMQSNQAKHSLFAHGSSPSTSAVASISKQGAWVRGNRDN